MQKNKWGMRDAWLLVLCAAVAVLVGSVIGKYGIVFGLDKYLVRILCQMPLIVPAIVGIIYICRTNLTEYRTDALGLKWFSPTFTFVLLVLPLCSRYFGLYIQSGGLGFDEKTFAVAAKTIPDDLYGMLMLFLSNCIIAPVFEEIIFRGAIFKAAEPYGSVRAIIVSSLGFALIHFETTAILYLLLWGIALGLIRVWSGSVIACMLFHSVLNFESFLHTVFVRDLYYVMDILVGYAAVVTYLFPVVLLITYLCFGRGKLVKKTAKSGIGGALPMIITFVLYGTVVYMKGL